MKRGNKGHLILKLLREAAGLTQNDLAAAIPTDRYTIGRIEKGQRVDHDLLVAWVNACGGAKLIDWLIDHLRALREYVELLTNTDYRAYA
ncbi:MAG: helix-turn-helix transcriptional regulator [Alicyclobacillus macrosporangiidus]|uniref:helix-turn-helix domain-containing protein n=1 Tax=Alicyclobacillus macrosporangiidus TaxID=392015 RepID=UPI0026EBD58B|nr:helix-turn-helix transcriptional regulator [Alicyclobacillus macrosporangiidus]MCL6599535.1 helix-turn-helix transcriptional regulator [Alicyclobacillus macrosporangiidus]